MGAIFNWFFARGGAENDDDVIGCDMAPAPSVLKHLLDPNAENGAASPMGIGPFTTMAQAPIRDG